MPRTKQETHKAEAITDVDVAHLQYLIRAIVAASEASDIIPQGGDVHANEHVVVDTDLDGVRYLLIRMPTADPARAMLSPRECEIVRMVAQGYQNKIIASLLNISTWTVCAHVRRVFAKFGVSSRAAMVAKLLETDIGLTPSVAGGTVGSTIVPRKPVQHNAPRPIGKAEPAGSRPALPDQHPEAVARTPRSPTARSRPTEPQVCSRSPSR